MDLLRIKRALLVTALSLSLAVPQASAVLVGEEDGAPDHTATAAWAIKFANGTLTVNADGTVSHDQAGAGGGTTDDDVTVNSSAVDTVANFLDGDIDWTLVDGGAGGPDDITGTLDATYAASLNVGSATALAANGANCSAGSAPLGVDASGASESCTDYEEDLSNSAGLAAALSDETGTGVAVFGTSPTFTTGITTPDITGTSGAMTITLGGAAADDLNIDSATLCVESDTNRVGIGTCSPSFLFEINSTSDHAIAELQTAAADKSAQFILDNGDAGAFDFGVDASGVFTIRDRDNGFAKMFTIEPNTPATTFYADSTGITTLGIVEGALADNTVGFADMVHTITLAGNPALAASQCHSGANGIICEGTAADSFEALLSIPVATSDKTITFQNATHTVIGRATTDTLTNKTITGASNNISATQLTSGTVPVARVGASHIDSTGEIASDIILESHLKAVDTAVDEECLTYESTTGDFEWQSCGGGGTAFNEVPLTVESAKLTGSFVTDGDATQGAQIDASDGNWRLLFDATTDEAAVWQFKMPNNYSSAPILEIIYSMTSATTLEVEYEGAIMCVTDADAADVGTASFSAVAVGSATVPGTAGHIDKINITLTDDSCAADDIAFVYLSTDSDDATNDDATGDREVIGVTLSYTAS